MRDDNPLSDLLASLDAIKELTTYCKTRNIAIEVRPDDGRAKFTTSPNNPSKTRWLGVLRQVSLYIKAKKEVQERAGREPDMLIITEKID